jgi:hypothetical protein
MNSTEAVERACQESSLVEALAWLAVWETDRVVQQAVECHLTGISTATYGAYDTCFQTLFRALITKWNSDYPAE